MVAKDGTNRGGARKGAGKRKNGRDMPQQSIRVAKYELISGRTTPLHVLLHCMRDYYEESILHDNAAAEAMDAGDNAALEEEVASARAARAMAAAYAKDAAPYMHAKLASQTISGGFFDPEKKDDPDENATDGWAITFVDSNGVKLDAQQLKDITPTLTIGDPGTGYSVEKVEPAKSRAEAKQTRENNRDSGKD